MTRMGTTRSGVVAMAGIFIIMRGTEARNTNYTKGKYERNWERWFGFISDLYLIYFAVGEHL